MNSPCKILLLEDRPDDLALIGREVAKAFMPA